MVPIAAGIGGLRDDGRGAARNTKQPPDRSPDRERLGHLISHLIGHPIGIGSVVTRASSDRDRLGRHLIGICSGSARSSSGSARDLLGICSALLCSARLGRHQSVIWICHTIGIGSGSARDRLGRALKAPYAGGQNRARGPTRPPRASYSPRPCLPYPSVYRGALGGRISTRALTAIAQHRSGYNTKIIWTYATP